MIEKIFFSSLGSDWRKETDREIGGYITLVNTTIEPLNVDKYQQIFTNTEKEVTKLFLAQSTVDIEIIQNFEEPLLNMSSVVEQKLAASRIIQYIEQRGASPVSFKAPLVYLVKPKPQLILALSIVLGGFLGIAFILMRKAIKSRTPSDF